MQGACACLLACALKPGSTCQIPCWQSILPCSSLTLTFRQLCRYDVIWIQWALLYLTDGMACLHHAAGCHVQSSCASFCECAARLRPGP